MVRSTSFNCYCTSVLRILGLVRDIRIRNLPINTKIFCDVYDHVEKENLSRVSESKHRHAVRAEPVTCFFWDLVAILLLHKSPKIVL